MSVRELRVLPDAHQLATAMLTALLRTIDEGLADRPRVDLALTGGAMGTQFAVLLAEAIPETPLDWSRVHLWWGDERFVDLGSDERNDLPLVVALEAGSPVMGPHLHRAPAPASDLDAHGAAQMYADSLREHRGAHLERPFFTAVLLGLGPDGHIASLFPGHQALAVASPCTSVTDSPKPPNQRITMTLPTLNDADQVWLIASGAGKHAALSALFTPQGHAELPAHLVKGAEATIIWADRAAASG